MVGIAQVFFRVSAAGLMQSSRPVGDLRDKQQILRAISFESPMRGNVEARGLRKGLVGPCANSGPGMSKEEKPVDAAAPTGLIAT